MSDSSSANSGGISGSWWNPTTWGQGNQDNPRGTLVHVPEVGLRWKRDDGTLADITDDDVKQYNLRQSVDNGKIKAQNEITEREKRELRKAKERQDGIGLITTRENNRTSIQVAGIQAGIANKASTNQLTGILAGIKQQGEESNRRYQQLSDDLKETREARKEATGLVRDQMTESNRRYDIGVLTGLLQNEQAMQLKRVQLGLETQYNYDRLSHDDRQQRRAAIINSLSAVSTSLIQGR